MPKAPSKQAATRTQRTYPYTTQASSLSSISTTTGTASHIMAAMTSPPTANMSHTSPNFMTSPMQERASAAWTEEDDQRLMEYRAKGQNWVLISEKFPNKTGNACRKRHERLIEKRNANHLDGVRLADLATAYVECRETMWKMVAERVGERWQVIEQKCMEKGIKTLTTNARAQRRNQPQVPTHDGALDMSAARPTDMEVAYGINGSFEEIYTNAGKVPSANAYFYPGQQDMTPFYPQQAPSQPHSRRASAAHSVGHSVDASSRAGSHGPPGSHVSMQPPPGSNPFASPQPHQQMPAQYYGGNAQGLAIAPTLNSQHFPTTTMAAAMHQQHYSTASNGLPPLQSSAFDAPRLPSIMSSQG